MLSRDSLLTRGLEPLAVVLWTLFALVSALVVVVWTFGIGEGSLEKWVGNPDLLRTLNWLLGHLDFAWITLAAAITYAGVAENEGLATVRRWAIWIVLAVGALAWLSSTATGPVGLGNPLGSIRYSLQLGPKLGPIPVGLPLLWLAIILGAREVVLWCFPRWSHVRVVLGTGALVALTDLSLEPVAAKARGFWFWQTGAESPPAFDPPPLQWLEWGLVASLLAWLFRSQRVAATGRVRSWKPAATLCILHVVFLSTHLARWLRG